MDKDHVPILKDTALLHSVVILLMALCFLLLEEVGLLVGPLNVVPSAFEHIAGSGCGYWLWGNSKGDIDGESGLSTIHQENRG